MKLPRDALKLDFLSHINTLLFRRLESNIDLLAVTASSCESRPTVILARSSWKLPQLLRFGLFI